ncbi:unnamed protein product [Vitrella brassicaformis CCMP3155]|uniref:Uncharacterized protein n=1 Tax=Vitrella brassicaformis (strain CCMP3155) TaxID=1169540 RepID=A0A0G4G819_VITBC|nr:unnamed protein product [Vitrella brassicaformis CCMP3155]|mmetsp:Transcript_33838/g.97536  ORF Transcript_33838/g.97536 Transcript_33838/m.97536 type:complete len:171 (-) Transcript_33838:746-1258(-)|eukprot:CEM24774.1 unnamed protein product [Vitrella brassicaformis CCMP3155]
MATSEVEIPASMEEGEIADEVAAVTEEPQAKKRKERPSGAQLKKRRKARREEQQQEEQQQQRSNQEGPHDVKEDSVCEGQQQQQHQEPMVTREPCQSSLSPSASVLVEPIGDDEFKFTLVRYEFVEDSDKTEEENMEAAKADEALFDAYVEGWLAGYRDGYAMGVEGVDG